MDAGNGTGGDAGRIAGGWKETLNMTDHKPETSTAQVPSQKPAATYSERNSHPFGCLILSGSGARKNTRNTRLPKSSGPQGQKKTALERAAVITIEY